MLFLFKKPEIHVDFFTYHSSAYEYAPIDYASKFLPEWWKRLPKSVHLDGLIEEKPTMKTCYGFTSYYRYGLMIPMWCDFKLEVGSQQSKKVGYVFADTRGKVMHHDTYQRGEYLNDQEYFHLKLIVPWLAKCKDSVPWVFQHSTWNFNEPEKLIIPPGIVEYKHQHALNVNMFVKMGETPYTLDIPFRTPMAHIIPLTEKRIVVHKHMISTEQWNEMNVEPIVKFINNIPTVKNMEKRKCPFNF